MYRTKMRIARQVGRRTGHAAAPFRGPRMHRDRVRTAVGSTAASIIAILRLSPCRLPEPGATDLGARPGFTASDGERREESP